MAKAFLISLISVLLASTPLHAQEITFTADADRTQLAVGESLKFTLTLSNTGSGGAMTTPDWGGLVVVQGPYESNRYSNINGQITRTSSRTWYLSATSAGDHVIGASTVRVGGGVLQTAPTTIHVTKGATDGNTSAELEQGQQSNPNLFCTISLSKNKAYVGEQVIATYTLFSRYGSLQSQGYDLPKLSGFWAEEVDLGQSDWEKALRTINGLQYHVAILKKQVLIPLRSGKLRVEPMTLNYLVDPGFFSRGTAVRIRSNVTELTVMDLPAGKPTDFIGAVGDLDLKVVAKDPVAKANEAIDLTIRFSGRANLKLIDAPKLNIPPDLEIYDPKLTDNITVNGAGMAGSREFQFLIIPRHEGKYDLGALTFSYFDPASATYKQLRSEPLVFDIGPGDAGSTSASGTDPRKEVQQLNTDIRYIRTGDLDLQPKGHFLFRSWQYAVGLVAPPALWLVLLLWTKRRERMMGDAVGVRRRGADKVAQRRLSSAKQALVQQDPSAFHDALGKALEGYIADRFNLGVAEVSPTTIAEKLGAFEEGRIAKAYNELIAECEMARFAPSEATPRQQRFDDAVALIRRIEDLLPS